jgi:hypothetical protein
MVAPGMWFNLGLVVGPRVGAGCNSNNFWYLRALLLDGSIVRGGPGRRGSQLAFYAGYLPDHSVGNFLDIHTAKDSQLFWSFL